ncbi:MAG: hypothetical protein WAZ94_00340 [Phycisphaerales bacterium]
MDTRYIVAGVLMLAAGQALADGLSGSVAYTDGGGTARPARRITMQIWAANPLGDTLLGEVRTDDTGAWTATVTPPPMTIGYFVRAVAVNDATRVTSGGAAPPYFVDVGGAPLGGGAIPATTIDTTGPDAARAFAVADALQTGWLYGGAMRGAAPARVNTTFPETGAGTASFYNSATGLHIRQWRRYAWDVLTHEYSHYLADIDTLDANPGGPHAFGVSNITPGPGGKLNGVRLAWGEALATYNGTAAQAVSAHPPSPTTGDTVYTSLNTDTPASTFAVNLDTHAGDGTTGVNAGEGDETSVMRILWDLADGTGGSEPHDRVTLGHASLYSMINNDIPGIDQLNGLWNHLITRPGATDALRVDYGAIFEEYGVSPHPIGDLIDDAIMDSDPAPTFEWVRRNNSDNDSFGLIVFDATLSTRLLDITIPGDVTSYTLTAGQWDTLNNHLGAARFIIRGSDTDQYATGSYWSDAYGFTIIPVPGAAPLAALAVLLGAARRRRT